MSAGSDQRIANMKLPSSLADTLAATYTAVEEASFAMDEAKATEYAERCKGMVEASVLVRAFHFIDTIHWAVNLLKPLMDGKQPDQADRESFEALKVVLQRFRVEWLDPEVVQNPHVVVLPTTEVK